MHFWNYQIETRSVAIYPRVGANIDYPCLGLAGEVGEICNKVKKVQRDHNGIITDEMKKSLSSELGDVLWYVAAVASELGLNLDDIAMDNIKKLKKRQAENKLQGSGDNR